MDRMSLPKLARRVSFLLLVPAALQAQPVQYSENGHYYEIIEASEIAWSDANAAAQLKSIPVGDGKVKGRLVSIESKEEFDFVENLRDAANVGPEFWIGAFQSDSNSDPDVGWQWVTGDTFPGFSNDPDSPFPPNDPNVPFDVPFALWQPGQPDDQGGPQGESYGTIGHDGDKQFYTPGFNDLTDEKFIAGYIVEYVVDSLSTCQSSGGCQTAPNGTKIRLQLQATAAVPAEPVTIAFSSELLFDPRIINVPADAPDKTSTDGWEEYMLTSGWVPVCDGTVLKIFDADNPAIVALTMPGFLCGSPWIEHITGVASNLSIQDGLAEFTAVQLDPNGGEAGPFICDLADGVDIRLRHRAVWQTTATLDGVTPDTPEAARFFPGNDLSLSNQVHGSGETVNPAANSYNVACGSIESRISRKSHFARGGHLQCNRPDNVSWAEEKTDVVACFMLLAEYKLALLEDEVNYAYAEGAISRGDFRKLLNQAQNARTKLSAGNVSEAESHIVNFLDNNERAKYTELDQNFFGRHRSRALNALFVLVNDIVNQSN